MMQILGLFLRSRRTAAISVLLSLVGGLSSALLLMLINRAMRTQSASAEIVVTFIGISMFTLGARIAAQWALMRVAQRAFLELRMELARKVARMPLRRLEAMGFPKILPILTDDVTSIVEVLQFVPMIFANLAIIVGCSAYLGYLSLPLLGVIAGLMVVGQLLPWLMRRAGSVHLERARQQQSEIQKNIRGLLEGNKELKLNAQRCEAYLNDALNVSFETFRKHDGARSFFFSTGNMFSKTVGLLIVGAAVFLPLEWPSVPVQIAFVTTLLFMVTSFDTIQIAIPQLARAQNAMKHIDQLSAQLDAEPPPGGLAVPVSFREIALRGVTHTYFNDRAKSFTLGPLDLVFQRGELVFLVGGNGSGKSTLAKVLTGLYTPEGGTIELDGVAIGDGNRPAFRQLFSAVFADFYLFDTIRGVDPVALETRATEYLQKLQLDHKVTIENGEFSTTALSTGQRKRLALIVAYLEDRPFYVFDEWAADQDPAYKDIFYRQLLPELKQRGKAILVISHDDKYFDVADRVIKLDYGKLQQLDAQSSLHSRSA